MINQTRDNATQMKKKQSYNQGNGRPGEESQDEEGTQSPEEHTIIGGPITIDYKRELVGGRGTV